MDLLSLIDMRDDNKSELTHEVTKTAMGWLLNNGFSAVVPEVTYGDCSYIADVMGWTEPSATEAYRLHLYDEKFMRQAYNDSITGLHKVMTGYIDDGMDRQCAISTAYKEAFWKKMQTIADAIGWVVIANIEVKTSRSDFTKDLRTKFSRRYSTIDAIAYPNGLIDQRELPDGWMGLECSKDGKRLYRVRADRFTPYRMDAETALRYQTRIFLRLKYWLEYKEQSKKFRDFYK